MPHLSDCAVFNEPAYPAGPCDCGGLELADDASHLAVPALVSGTRSVRLLGGEVGAVGLIEAHHLPADGLVVDATASDLPASHDGVPGS